MISLLKTLRGACLGVIAALALSATAMAAATPPEQVIKDATTTIQTDITRNVAKYQADKSSFYKMVDTEIVPHFDTTYIAKVILGTHLKEASPEQVTQFEAAFKDMLVHSYADKLLQYYDSVSVDVKPGRIASDGKRATVDTTLIRKDGQPPIAVQFSMRDDNGEWKIWDIKAENISLVLNFRTQIDGEIKKSSIASVIQRLDSGQIQADVDHDGTASKKQ
ncbi:MlaC/ttg2D family ABC transporter substrate-binding protein [Solimonas terrae]|uniref:ABC transporter substrate-binding protein n=1 Tax=Solimonas terrae TaxID=1396819 RepID=A0A6M2BWZ7_9GAMM|nr:ABC transporter substrate-binding protein [Solimonas terrae]NGY06711.1 ABC transporter substrate-binding protein [Solimonas terrae]